MDLSLKCTLVLKIHNPVRRYFLVDIFGGQGVCRYFCYRYFLGRYFLIDIFAYRYFLGRYFLGRYFRALVDISSQIFLRVDILACRYFMQPQANPFLYKPSNYTFPNLELVLAPRHTKSQTVSETSLGCLHLRTLLELPRYTVVTH